ncbi:MFS transporter [Microlunatus soli]|uniref:Sugar phosphate permease n=1 Tax=Microlunatus soli TaxID=630515 RepID=A0A1H1MVK5_9ACTN|nr:MFS transporter [Microlunatus soli]SDR90883.1 Sugar phosphate permease [Microlunatus soli]
MQITSSSTTARTSRVNRVRVAVVVMLLLAGTINYIDRSTLSIANHDVSAELGLSSTEMGLVFSVFSWAYAFAQLPAGPLLDRLGARMVLGMGLIVWSAAQVLAGLSHGIGQLVGARVLLGVGEAPTFPANAKIVSQWFPPGRRGVPLGVATAASTVGPAIAPPILTWLLLAHGWRVMFIVIGVIGILVGLVWMILYRSPETRTAYQEGLAALGVTTEATDERQPWSIKEWLWLLRHRTSWAMIGGFTGVIYSVYLYLTWLPEYLQSERGLSIAAIGWALVLPYAFGTVGQLLGGIVGDALISRGVPVVTARKIPVVGGLLVGGLCSIPTALAPTTGWALVAICGVQLFINIASSGGWVMAATLADKRTTASLGSLQNFGGYFGGAFAPLVTGAVVGASGSFVLALLIASVVAVLAAGLYAWGVRKPIPPLPAVALNGVDPTDADETRD